MAFTQGRQLIQDKEAELTELIAFTSTVGPHNFTPRWDSFDELFVVIQDQGNDANVALWKLKPADIKALFAVSPSGAKTVNPQFTHFNQYQVMLGFYLIINCVDDFDTIQFYNFGPTGHMDDISFGLWGVNYR